MRSTSVPLSAAFMDGVTSQGHNVIDAGLGSTDLLYFASGWLGLPGAVFTASHNPAQYNGIKLCQAGAKPVGQDTGLRDIRRMLDQGIPPHTGAPGSASAQDLLSEYTAYLRSKVDLSGIRRLRVAVDAGNGMAGHMVPAVLGHAAGAQTLPLDIVPMYFELDGSFPNHEANPSTRATWWTSRRRSAKWARTSGWRSTATRTAASWSTRTATRYPPSAIVALIATRELAKHPGSAVVYNVITSQAVPEIITENGGIPVRCRVGTRS